jgi:hypothetical protein
MNKTVHPDAERAPHSIRGFDELGVNRGHEEVTNGGSLFEHDG